MSQMVQNLAVSALKPHPKNNDFFSNAEGDDFNRLKESIEEQGILTPLRVSSDMVIVSGHQRYRAACELGMKLVPVIVDESLLDEDEKLAQLIASNFGRMKNDPIKQGRWIKEYERLKGVKRGRPEKRGNNFPFSQDDIAKELGVDVRTLKNLKRLNNLLPELQDVISEGRINATTGYKLIARLSEDEQQQLLGMLPATERLTQKQVQSYVDEIRAYQDKIDELTSENQKEKLRADEMQKEAVEAARAIAGGTDSEKYMEMQRKMQEAQEQLRKEHEAYVKLKENTQRASLKTSKEVEAMRAELKKAKEKADKVPDMIEIEVYPSDYEELKQKARMYDDYVENGVNEKDVHSLNSPEEQQRQYEQRFLDVVEGFLPEFSGLLLDENGIRNMSASDQDSYKESLNEIVRVANAMLNIINERREVA